MRTLVAFVMGAAVGAVSTALVGRWVLNELNADAELGNLGVTDADLPGPEAVSAGE